MLYDGHGSTGQLVDSSEDITDAYSYDAYGMMLGGNPGSAANPNAAATNLLYAGEHFDTDMQMYYNRRIIAAKANPAGWFLLSYGKLVARQSNA